MGRVRPARRRPGEAPDPEYDQDRPAGEHLQAGETKTCTNVGRASGGFVDGYVQVRASQPLLVGGYIDLPVLDYEQVGGGTPRLKFLNRGTVQRLHYDWKPGCPPKPGGGCPTGQSPALAQP